MLASEFSNKKNMINRYFNNEYKWKSKDGDWQYQYYKGKRNLKELQFILDVIFGDDLNVVETGYFYNNDNELIGGTVFGVVDVCADFNGMQQGSGRGGIYISFTLCQHGFFYNQSQTLEGLKKLHSES